MLSFFKILLYLYSNENEIIIGVTTNNRNYNEIQNLIGFFVNSLPIKLIFDENDNYLNIIKKINEEVLNMQLNQDLPFEIIVNLLKLQRDINKNPMFEILFNYLNFENEEKLELNNLKIEEYDEIKSIQSKFDFSINFLI
jgi:non-ribosomal peptide synthetase component F